MLAVYHYPLCPFSRKLRAVLREKSVEFELISEMFWLHNTSFLRLNPAAQTPVIQTANNFILSGNTAIFEWLDEKYPHQPTVYGNFEQKAEVRRLDDWFDNKLFDEVTKYLFHEKVVKTLDKKQSPNSVVIQAAKRNLVSHLQYIEFLTRDSRYLVGDIPTRADFAAAAQLSVLDFLDEIPWAKYKKVKYWYSLMKSRPSFRGILNDIVPGFTPPPHYNNPDF